MKHMTSLATRAGCQATLACHTISPTTRRRRPLNLSGAWLGLLALALAAFALLPWIEP